MSSVRMSNDTALDGEEETEAGGDCCVDDCADTTAVELTDKSQQAIVIGRNASIGGGPRFANRDVLRRQTCSYLNERQDP